MMIASTGALTVAEAAKQLRASEPTVRKLIGSGELPGSIIPTAGSRRRFATTQDAVSEFLRERGEFPHARQRPRSRLSALERRVAELEGRQPTPSRPTKSRADSPGENATLREVIRTQNEAIEQLNLVLRHQSEAIDLEQRAHAAQLMATTAALAAHEAQRSLAAVHGIPDDASELSP